MKPDTTHLEVFAIEHGFSTLDPCTPLPTRSKTRQQQPGPDTPKTAKIRELHSRVDQVKREREAARERTATTAKKLKTVQDEPMCEQAKTQEEHDGVVRELYFDSRAMRKQITILESTIRKSELRHESLQACITLLETKLELSTKECQRLTRNLSQANEDIQAIKALVPAKSRERISTNPEVQRRQWVQYFLTNDKRVNSWSKETVTHFLVGLSVSIILYHFRNFALAFNRSNGFTHRGD